MLCVSKRQLWHNIQLKTAIYGTTGSSNLYINRKKENENDEKKFPLNDRFSLSLLPWIHKKFTEVYPLSVYFGACVSRIWVQKSHFIFKAWMNKQYSAKKYWHLWIFIVMRHAFCVVYMCVCRNYFQEIPSSFVWEYCWQMFILIWYAYYIQM